MNEKIVVTGASGFIGTNLLQYLEDRQYVVYNLDIAAPRMRIHTKYWVKVDVTKFNELQEVLLRIEPDFIIHLAARTDLGGGCLKDYETNTIGVTNLVECIKLLPSVKKVIFASSMLVDQVGYMPKSENDYRPNTFYGESKVMTEQIVKSGELKCDWVIIRPTSIWGPWFGVPYRNYFEAIVSKQYIHIGNRSATMTYGYIGNAVYQIYSLLLSRTSDLKDKVYYIGDYEPTNLEEWSNEIAESLGTRIHKLPYWCIHCVAFLGDMLIFLHIPFPMTTFRLHNMTTDNICNLENLQKITPTLPYSRKEGIKITLDWMRENSSRESS